MKPTAILPQRRGSSVGAVASILLCSAMPLAGCNAPGAVGRTAANDQALVMVQANDGTAAHDSKYCTSLMAGQSTNAGSVCLSSTGETVEVKYTTWDGWELTEAHLWMGEQLGQMPATRTGSPKIGNFPHKSGTITGRTSYTFTIPVATLGGEPYVCNKTFFLAAHAALRKQDGSKGGYRTETGWGNGHAILQKGSWATYFSVNLHCTGTGTGTGGGTGGGPGDEPPPPTPDQVCETAFAYGGSAGATCFIGADFDGDGQDDGLQRWGWSNGPLAPGSYSFPIYQGAGQCDRDKGVLVGTLLVRYDGATATATFAANAGYALNETHLYIGSEPLPRKNGEYTVAPGQFPYQHAQLADGSRDTFTVTGLSGSIYVVAHAVTCKDATPPPPPAPVAYTWSEFIGSAAEVWPGLPSDFRDFDTRAGSVEINTNGGVGAGGANQDPAFESSIVTLRNGAPAILEQKQVNRRWPPGLDSEGCNPSRPFPECWTWRQPGEQALSILVPERAAGSNAGFDSVSPRVEISGGIEYDYARFTGQDNGYQTALIRWQVPAGRVLRQETQSLFRARYDRCADGLDASDIMIALFYVNGANPADDLKIPAVTVAEDTTTSLAVRVNVKSALEYVRSEYTRLGLTCP